MDSQKDTDSWPFFQTTIHKIIFLHILPKVAREQSEKHIVSQPNTSKGEKWKKLNEKAKLEEFVQK